MNKHKIKIIIAIILLVLISFVQYSLGSESVIRILYINDFHGSIEPSKSGNPPGTYGGIAYLANTLRKLRAQKPSLLLSAGDMMGAYPHPLVGREREKEVIELMNVMQFDAMVVGNHEFECGIKNLEKRILEAKFPILGANVEGLPLLKPYVVKEILRVKVAIIGVVTMETPFLYGTTSGKTDGLKFVSPMAAIKKYLPEIKNKADIIIVLSHLGYPVDRKLAELLSGINIIVGGHTHTRIDKPVIVNQTIIVQAWEYGKALGVLDLTVKEGKVIKADGYLEIIKPHPGLEDKSIADIVNKYSNSKQ